MYEAYVNSPTTFGSFVVRIVLRSEEDQPTVNGYQDELATELIERSEGAAPNTEPLTPEILGGGPEVESPEELLSLAAKLNATNPPEVAADAENVNAMFEAAGLNSDGSYTQPEGTNLTAAANNISQQLVYYPSTPGASEVLGDQWTVMNHTIVGNFGTHYVMRSYIALWTYLQLTADQAIYPLFRANASSLDQELILQEGEAYQVKFSGKPQVDGFWSLTLYDKDGYLVENGINRSSLGDRSGITYTDGEPIYGDGSNPDRDDEFFFIIQHDTPAEKWTSK
jgi:hypothetical protein